MKEPEIGEYVRRTGAVICHIMRPSYIGQKVLYDCSTQSMRNLYKCGVLEEYIPYDGTWRSIIYDGKKQRVLLTHRPGIEIYECMPWDWYDRLTPCTEDHQLSIWEVF